MKKIGVRLKIKLMFLIIFTFTSSLLISIIFQNNQVPEKLNKVKSEKQKMSNQKIHINQNSNHKDQTANLTPKIKINSNKKQEQRLYNLLNEIDYIELFEEDEAIVDLHFSGEIKKLDWDPKIFSSDGIEWVYFEIGTFENSNLKGYRRIIAMNNSNDPFEPKPYFFATKDYENYVLNISNLEISTHQRGFELHPETKSKIIGFTKFFPTELKINNDFILTNPRLINSDKFDKNHSFEAVKLTFKSFYENNLFKTGGLKNLTSPFENYKIYGAKQKYFFSKLIIFPRIRDEEIEAYMKNDPASFKNEASVLVVDEIGFPIVYQIESMSLSNPFFPKNINFNSSYNQNSFYKKYTKAIGYNGCLNFPNAQITHVVNLNEKDLNEIGSANNTKFYVLKEKNHPLNKFAYQKIENGINSFNGFERAFKDSNKSLSIPSIEKYLKKNPLIFIKDPWNRWLIFQESEIFTSFCG